MKRKRKNISRKKESKLDFLKNKLISNKKNDKNESTKNNKNLTENTNKKDNISKKKNTKNINKNNNKSTKKKKERKLWKKILTGFLILCIIGIICIMSFFAYIAITAPKFSEDAFEVKDQTVVYDINGEIIATLGAQKRESVTYDDLPQVLVDAIIATEDSRFFQHNGVDLPRFIKATFMQLMGKNAGGASTLTMQTAKNNLTKKDTIEKNKIDKVIRKFQDVYLAVFKVEKKYTKEKIIELYVNNYNLGSNIYGVGEASKYYFGKSVSELTLPEASLIAGLFQAPNGHNPYKNIESATKRRNTVLDLMVRHGYITKEEADIAKNIEISSLIVGENNSTPYQGFVDVVVNEVEELTKQNPYTTPMKIYTTMEKSIQDGINSVLSNDAWYWKNDSLVQAGIAVVNVETGAISAVGNGRNRPNQLRIFNYATEALKQPGSTAKPLFDYGPAIEYNNYSTYTLFNDEPWTYTNGPAVNNWDGAFNGLMTLKNALNVSRNIPALKTFQQIGPKNSQKFAYSLGIDVALNKNSENYRIVNESTGVDNIINEAYSIGGMAEGTTPLTLAAAYSGFASGGYYTKPYSVTKIEFRETGEVQELKHTKERVMKDSTAYIINNILRSAVTDGFDGGSRNASNKGSIIAAKTGTTNYDDNTIKKYKLPYTAVNDLWTVAYTSQYSVAVWYGYDSIYDKESGRTTYNVNTGGFKEGVVSAVLDYIPIDRKGWTRPSSVVESQVEFGTWPAKLPSAYTPQDLIRTELFVRGSQPSEVSERFTQLNDISNVKFNTTGYTTKITWDYKIPEQLTEKYLKQYFNNSLYGNEKDNYLNQRIDYNNNTLGPIVFSIYKKEANGNLVLIETVKEKEYSYTGYGTNTLVIKAMHQNYVSNASNGYEIELKLNSTVNGNLNATLKDRSTINTTVGTYKEPGFEKITFTTAENGQTDITKKANITYQVNINNNIKTFTKINDLETYINSQEAGKVEITYIIKYLNKSLNTKRIVYLT